MGTNVLILFIDTALLFSAIGELSPQSLAMLGSLQRVQNRVRIHDSRNSHKQAKTIDRMHIFLLETNASSEYEDADALETLANHEQLKKGLKELNPIFDGELRILSGADINKSSINSYYLNEALKNRNVTMVTISYSENFEHEVNIHGLFFGNLQHPIQHWTIGNIDAGFENLTLIETRVKDLLEEPIARKLAPNQRKGSLVWLPKAPTNEALLRLIYNDSSIEWVLLPDGDPQSPKNLSKRAALIYTCLLYTSPSPRDS